MAIFAINAIGEYFTCRRKRHNNFVVYVHFKDDLINGKCYVEYVAKNTLDVKAIGSVYHWSNFLWLVVNQRVSYGRLHNII